VIDAKTESVEFYKAGGLNVTERASEEVPTSPTFTGALADIEGRLE